MFDLVYCYSYKPRMMHSNFGIEFNWTPYKSPFHICVTPAAALMRPIPPEAGHYRDKSAHAMDARMYPKGVRGPCCAPITVRLTSDTHVAYWQWRPELPLNVWATCRCSLNWRQCVGHIAWVDQRPTLWWARIGESCVLNRSRCRCFAYKI